MWSVLHLLREAYAPGFPFKSKEIQVVWRSAQHIAKKHPDWTVEAIAKAAFEAKANVTTSKIPPEDVRVLFMAISTLLPPKQ